MPEAPHDSLPEQVPQLETVRVEPHLSVPLTEPQLSCRRAQKSASVSQPHTLGVPPPPQVRGCEQEPHDSVPPHPSGTAPQSLPRPAQVAFTQLSRTTSGPASIGGRPSRGASTVAS